MTGLGRVTSGLPFGDQVGAGWVTSWYYQSFLVKTGTCRDAQAHHPRRGSGGLRRSRLHWRHASRQHRLSDPLSHSRRSWNPQRISRRWLLRDRLWPQQVVAYVGTASLKFGWEVFNVTNSPRFDVNPNTSLQSVWGSGDFGVYSAQLPRIAFSSSPCARASRAVYIYCALIKIARRGFLWKKTTKRPIASPDFLQRSTRREHYVRLSSRKVACSSVVPPTSTGNPGVA